MSEGQGKVLSMAIQLSLIKYLQLKSTYSLLILLLNQTSMLTYNSNRSSQEDNKAIEDNKQFSIVFLAISREQKSNLYALCVPACHGQVAPQGQPSMYGPRGVLNLNASPQKKQRAKPHSIYVYIYIYISNMLTRASAGNFNSMRSNRVAVYTYTLI